MEGSIGQPVDDGALNILFREARTFSRWQPRPVSDETLHALYDLGADQRECVAGSLRLMLRR